MHTLHEYMHACLPARTHAWLRACLHMYMYLLKGICIRIRLHLICIVYSCPPTVVYCMCRSLHSHTCTYMHSVALRKCGVRAFPCLYTCVHMPIAGRLGRASGHRLGGGGTLQRRLAWPLCVVDTSRDSRHMYSTWVSNVRAQCRCGSRCIGNLIFGWKSSRAMK